MQHHRVSVEAVEFSGLGFSDDRNLATKFDGPRALVEGAVVVHGVVPDDVTRYGPPGLTRVRAVPVPAPGVALDDLPAPYPDGLVDLGHFFFGGADPRLIRPRRMMRILLGMWPRRGRTNVPRGEKKQPLAAMEPIPGEPWGTLSSTTERPTPPKKFWLVTVVLFILVVV